MKIIKLIISSKISQKYFWFLVLIFAMALAIRLGIYIFTDFVADDAYILAKIAKNFANGFGLVYNIGDNIQANTSLLFSFILGLLWKIFGSISMNITRIAGAFIDSAVALGIVWLLSSSLNKENDKNKNKLPFLALAAGMLYAIMSITAIPAVMGLETSYFVFTIVALFIALQKKYFNLAILLAIISVFIRPDGIIAAVITVFTVWFEQKKITPRQIFIILLGAGLYSFIVLTIYGTLIPQTVIAKSLVRGTSSGQWLSFLKKFYISGFVLFPGFLSVVGIYRIFKHLRNLIPICMYGLVYVFIISNFGSWWYWYFPSFVVVYVISIFVGIEQIRDKIVKLGAGFKNIPVLFMWVMSILILLGFATKTYTSILLIEPNHLIAQKKEIILVSDWIKLNIPYNKTMMLEPAGFFGFLLPYKIDDYPGLASRRVTDVLGEYKKIGGNPKNFEGFVYAINMIKPDFIIFTKEEYNKFIKTDMTSQYKMSYSCCSDLKTQFGPYFVLIREE